MMRIRRSRQSEEDVVEIALHIAEHRVAAARRFIESVDETLKRLSRMPLLGRRRDELQPGLRSVPLGNYILFYKVDDDAVCLVRVLHASRRLEDLL